MIPRRRGLVSLPNVQDAVPFEQGLRTRQTALSEQELEKKLEGASSVVRDRERIKRARHEDKGRDMRVEYPEQRPDREVTERTGASSSRDGAGNEQEATGGPVAMSEPQPRKAEQSVGHGQLPREQGDDADMSDLDSDRRRPRESLGEEREPKRVRINVLGGEESDEWVETEKEWVRNLRRHRRDLFSLHDSQGGPKLSDISNKRESVVCGTGGGELRIVYRWSDKESENRMHGETCRRSKKETPKDLPHEWTGNTKFRKSWGALSEQTQSKQQRFGVGSACIGKPKSC